MRPFRIQRQRRQLTQLAMAEEQGSVYSDYMNRLAKLIPSEVIGVYLVVSGIARLGPGSSDNGDWMTAWWPVCCVLLVVGSRIWGTSADGSTLRDVQWKGVVISTVSFIIWVYAMGHTILHLLPPDERLPAIAVVLWTFVIPWFYKGGEG